MRTLWIGVVVLAACSPAVKGGADDGTNPDANGSGSGSNGFPNCDPANGNTCSGDSIVTCNPDGTFGSVVMACGDGMTCAPGAPPTCTNACTADGVDLVYVVSEANEFMSFDPRKLSGSPFTPIGTLTCPTTKPVIQTPNPGGAPNPFSMSIDRDGKAWVLYTDGEIFNVSLTTAACTATAYVPQAGGMKLFGMGFVTDTAGGDTEQLFIAGGGTDPSVATNRKLASVDTHGAMYTPVAHGNVPTGKDYAPELTGTNEARLFAFYPALNVPSFVTEVDRTTGAAIGTPFNLGTSGLGTQVQAWAFAQWGGKFYVFVTSDNNSTVRVVDRSNGNYTLAKENLPYKIVGAGVSTCAPSVLQ